MEVEVQQHSARNEEEEATAEAVQSGHMSRELKVALIVLNCVLMALGNTGGPLLVRLYFLRGGSHQWLSSWLETGGWPLIFFPLLLNYAARRRHRPAAEVRLFYLTPRLLVPCLVVGLLTGADDFLYTYGLEFLPVSTSAILISTQLAFTAFFAFLVVGQRFTASSLNAVALLTAGAVVLGMHASSERPAGVSRAQYFLGFILTLGAAALYGLVLPLVELTYRRAGQPVTYALVLEMNLVISFFATVFCTVGMLVNNDFQGIPKEANSFELGEVRYYVVLVIAAIFWQFFFLGAYGVIFCANTLLASVLIAVFIPVTEILAVIFFKEKFSSDKVLSLVLSLWGLASYSYGEYKQRKEKKVATLVENRAPA